MSATQPQAPPTKERPIIFSDPMTPYLALVREALEHGDPRPDRTGTGTRS